MIPKLREKEINGSYTDMFNESCCAYSRNDSFDYTVILLYSCYQRV